MWNLSSGQKQLFHKHCLWFDIEIIIYLEINNSDHSINSDRISLNVNGINSGDFGNGGFIYRLFVTGYYYIISE